MVDIILNHCNVFAKPIRIFSTASVTQAPTILGRTLSASVPLKQWILDSSSIWLFMRGRHQRWQVHQPVFNTPQLPSSYPDYIVETVGVRTMAYDNPGQSWPPLQKHFPNIHIIPPKMVPQFNHATKIAYRTRVEISGPHSHTNEWPADQARQDTVPTASHVGTVPPLGSAAYASASCKSTGRLGNWKVRQISYWYVRTNMIQYGLGLEFAAKHHSSNTSILWIHLWCTPSWWKFLFYWNFEFTEVHSPQSTKLGTELRPLSSIQNLQNPSYIPRL